MKIKTTLIFVLIFLTSCVNEEDFLLCNSQDPESYCYLPPPSSKIDSYSPNKIIVYDDLTNINDPQINNAESLQIKSITDNNTDSTYIVPIIDKTFEFIDSALVGNIYQYEMAYVNFDNEFSSFTRSDSLIHKFDGIDNLSVNLINENELILEWQYNYSNYFKGPAPDSLNYKITKYNQDIPTEFINLTLPTNDSLNFNFKDNSIQIGDILQYTLEIQFENLLSNGISTEIVEINFPECSITNWIPLSSYQIYLEWECTEVINNNLPRIKLSNEFTQNNQYLFDIYNSEGKGFFIDDLSTYVTNLDESIAGKIIEYNLEWEGTSGQSLDENFELQTFPINHMVFVPALNQFYLGNENDNIINNTRSFYIDKYEITESQILDPSSNPFQKWDSPPPNEGVSFNQAINFCTQRTNAFLDEIIPGSGDISVLEFTLPNEIDWEIAASAEYLDIDLNGLHYENQSFFTEFTNKYFYPVSIGNGLLNCNYANIQSCYNGPLSVGLYNGDSSEFQESISPSGLYDCSGNVQEWVIKSDLINHFDIEREILRGGSYASSPSESSNLSYIYEYPETQHNSFGFRTIIYAENYLNYLRSSYDPK